MRRRGFLAGTAVSCLGMFGGCTAVGSETHLRAEVERTDSRETLRFGEGDEDVASVSLRRMYDRGERRRYYPFRVSTWQREDLRLSSLKLAFRSPPHSSGFTPAGISLNEDGHAGRADIYRKDEDASTTVVELSDLEGIGKGSVGLDLLVSGDTEAEQRLWTRASGSLTGDGLVGDDYSVRGDMTLDLP